MTAAEAIGTSDIASSAAFVRNNILQNNGDSNIKVFSSEPRSDVNFQGDFNLVFPGDTYLPSSLQMPHDVAANARS